MGGEEAGRAWRTAGRTLRWVLLWPRRRLLRLMKVLFEEDERLQTVQDALRAEHEQQIRDRDARIASLERRLGRRQKDSRTSSKPPSTDGPAARSRTHPARRPSRRRPGGQPGHPGHRRPVVPAEQVTRVVPVLPDTCPDCHHVFTDAEQQTALSTDVHRYQVADLPVAVAEITDVQRGFA